jgi:hypothetical protein
MTLDRDPDRLVETWLDEGPRSFSPRLLDRTLADIHSTPQRRHRWMPWRPPTMNLTLKTGLAGALVLALVLGTGSLLPWLPRLAVGPVASPSPSPVTSPAPSGSPSPSPSPAPVPAPSFVSGPVPLVGPTWLLVGILDDGRAEGDPDYISAVPGAPATLRFTTEGTLSGTTGCNPLTGTYDAQPKGEKTVPADLVLDPIDAVGCVEPLGTQDQALVDDLDGAGAIQLTNGGYDELASSMTDADLDPTLLDHYRQHPNLTRLIIRDQSGEGSAIYAPIHPDGSAASPVPAPSGPPAQA